MTELITQKTATYTLSVSKDERELYDALFRMFIEEATEEDKVLVHETLTAFVKRKHKKFVDFCLVSPTLRFDFPNRRYTFDVKVITSVKY